MDALEQLRTKIPRFPGYVEEGDRRLGDELVRSYLGEALAELQSRLQPVEDGLAGSFGQLLLRAGFTNQVAFKVYEYAQLDQTRVDAISQSDARLIELGDKAPQIETDTVEAYLHDVAAAFDARDAAMVGSVQPKS